MPFKNPQRKKQYNRRYHNKKLGKLGSYITLGNTIYPIILDTKEPDTCRDSFAVGRRRVREFKNMLPREYPESEGYTIRVNRVEGRGVDVKIWKNGKLHTVMELTNYRKSSYFSRKTALRYKKSLSSGRFTSAKKIVVVSYPENIPTEFGKEFRKRGIKIREMGYQA